MIVSLALSLIAIASGYVLTYTYEENEPLASRLCAGACIGFALMGLIGFTLALALDLNATSIILTAAVLAAPLLLLTRAPYRRALTTDLASASEAARRITSHPRLTLRGILFSFNGRIAGGTYLLSLLGLLIGSLLIAWFHSQFFGDGPLARTIAGLMWLAYIVVSVWITLAVQVKRWHDLDYSGWMALTSFIPIIGFLISFFYLGFARGTNASNRYGPDPEPARSWPIAGYLWFYAIVSLTMWLIFQRALLDEAGGMFTGVLNNYGDLPFHLSVITRFAYGQNFPPEDPTFAGVRFTYPFLTDFISAMFVRAGASLRNAMFIENYIISVALVGVLHRFGQRLVRNRTAAILTPLLVLLNGGFGWTLLWEDVQKIEGGVFRVLRHIPHSYTILPEVEKAWRWGNSITSLLVTQRGFLLGIPLAVIAFGLWWRALNEDGEKGKGEKGKGEKGKGEKGKARKHRREDDREAAAPTSSPFSHSPFTLFPLSPSGRRMLAAGFITGLLPLIHAHSFISIMLVAAFLVPWVYWRAWIAYAVAAVFGGIIFFTAASYEAAGSPLMKVAFAVIILGLIANLWFLLPRRHLRLWICFFVVALVVGLPQIFWSTRGTAVKTQSFIAWQFGWDSDQQTMFGSKPVGSQPIETTPPISKWVGRAPYVVWFWFKNTGVFIPLLLVALVWKPDGYLVPRKLLLFYLPFTLCFLVPNFVKLAPWVWDNIKMIFYWWIASAPIVALLVARLWEQHVGQKVIAASLLVLLTLAGALDIFPLLTRQGEYQEFDRDGVKFSESIKQTTPHDATILHAPIHNTPVYLTGRRSLMGYPGHIWTHGIDFGPREQDIKQIYSGGPAAASLLTKYGVDYVVIGPQEQSVVNPNLAFFDRYPLVARIDGEFGEYRLYKITPR